jgi:uncharacterized membrane protein
MSEIGPVQMVAIAFGPDARFEGRIMAELAKLEQQETIRILDLLFVSKDPESGDLVALDYQGEDLGAIIGALLGFEFDWNGGSGPEAGADGHAFGLTRAQIEAMGESLEPGHSAGFLLIEHVWARDFKRAIRDAGGVPIGEGFLTPEAVGAVAEELVAMSAAVEEAEAESAHGTASGD